MGFNSFLTKAITPRIFYLKKEIRERMLKDANEVALYAYERVRAQAETWRNEQQSYQI